MGSEGRNGPMCLDIEAFDFKTHIPVLDLAPTPIWLYQCHFCRNMWGNKAALQLFGVTQEQFCSSQLDHLTECSPAQLRNWMAKNTELYQTIEVGKGEKSLTLKAGIDVEPGFLSIANKNLQIKGVYKPLRIVHNRTEKDVIMIQVTEQVIRNKVVESHVRMTDMCDNHPMFQFLFEETGKLLAANKRAVINMTEHLGCAENFTLKQYLSVGEFDGMNAEAMYDQAMEAIFKQKNPCYRFSQVRMSKRHPGKTRWVLFEMWPLVDPISMRPAVLVTEQNITQVKALEEQFRRENERLQDQLEEALANKNIHHPAIDIDTPADKTLKLLDKIMKGSEVTAKEAMELREAILTAGDLRQPVNLGEQLLKGKNEIDSEVGQSLIQLLSNTHHIRQSSREDGNQEVIPDNTFTPPELMSTTTTSDIAALDRGAQQIMSLCKDVPSEVNDVLATIDHWQFDAFRLCEVSNGRPLSMLGYVLLKRFDIIHKFALDETKLVRFLMRVEDGYPHNPYHNRIHAAGVLQSLHVLVVRGGLLPANYCDDISLMSCYLSAIIHDFEHKGVNNDYLVRVSDGLAILYNDKSPLENHHLAASFQTMHTDDYNFLAKVPAKIREGMRKQIIDMVLATDMKQHFAIHSMFQAKMQLNGSRTSGNSSQFAQKLAAAAEPRHIDDDQKSLVLQVALKLADLGHLASPRTVHKKWVDYLEEEFFLQGEREKQNQLTVSPLMDREKNGITKSQVGFFDIVALPLFQSFAQAFQDATPMLEAVKDNYVMWKEDAMKAGADANGK